VRGHTVMHHLSYRFECFGEGFHLQFNPRPSLPPLREGDTAILLRRERIRSARRAVQWQ
jgi:hypothetical protein